VSRRRNRAVSRRRLVPVPALLVTLVSMAAPLAGQTAASDRRNRILIEAAGSALVYSVNYERVLAGDARGTALLGRAGVMLLPWMRGSWALPVGLALRAGGDRHALEVGGLRVFGDLDDHDFPPGWSLVAAWRGTFGRLVVRTGVTSLISDPVDFGERDTRWLWPLASVGWAF